MVGIHINSVSSELLQFKKEKLVSELKEATSKYANQKMPHNIVGGVTEKKGGMLVELHDTEGPALVLRSHPSTPGNTRGLGLRPAQLCGLESLEREV
jgi:GTP cyclohydrolase II